MKEVWKDIEGYGGNYQVSNFGRIKSVERIILRTNGKSQTCKETILKPLIRNRYECVILCSTLGRKTCKVHRLVAQAFIPNPDNLPQVNHKDENKLNNLSTNLEWCTNEYNCNYGSRNKRITKWIYEQYTLSGKFLRTFTPAELLAHNFDRGCCRLVSKGIRKTYKGFIWRLKPLEI